MPKLEPYTKQLEYSYCLGLYPSLALLDFKPHSAMRLLLSPAGIGNPGVEKLRERCAFLGIREETAERVLRRESGKDNCYAGIVFKKYSCNLSSATRHVVFDKISDSGNLGTAIRSALGFGFNDFAMIKPCVDPFDPHVVRASMGAVFKLNLKLYDSFEAYLTENGGRTVFPFMLDGAITLNEAVKQAPENYTLVFGNEASGLESRFASYGQSVLIPQSRQIDSLNLAVAASIAMYTFNSNEKQQQ